MARTRLMTTIGSIQPQTKIHNECPLGWCQVGHLVGGRARLKIAAEAPNRKLGRSLITMHCRIRTWVRHAELTSERALQSIAPWCEWHVGSMGLTHRRWSATGCNPPRQCGSSSVAKQRGFPMREIGAGFYPVTSHCY